MSILSGSDLSQSFGAFDLFRGISVAVAKDAKVGLVGPNGVGKTTLLLIFAGLASPSSGKVHRSRGARLGYLPQESSDAFLDPRRTVYQEMLVIFAGLRQEEARLHEMEAEMAEGELTEAFLESYSKAQERFELAGGYDYELRIRQVLDGLGFPANKQQMPLGHLSGGQKTRVLLARLLLEKPDLLILDEPTNHLDVQAIRWLEGALSAWEGAVVLVSHDRYFLDRVVNTIWEMSRSGIENYRGNYSAYVQQRRERWERRLQQYETFKARMEKELDYIRRNIAGQRTQMAKGKLKRITRELKAVQALGLRATQGKRWSQITAEVQLPAGDWGVAEAAHAIRTLRPPSGRPPQLNLRLRTDRRSGRTVLRANDLVIGYPDAPLFEADDIELTRLECAALIGPNGAGKTTFLRTILGKQAPLAGKLRPGASLKIGYFAQAHEQLNPEYTVLDELLAQKNIPLSQARNYLAQYLFRGDDVYKTIQMLSGGERGRLALALLAREDANFLLLDEPTNHLDIPSQEVLQAVLENFDGTILLVSHDRYLINRLATQVWELKEGRLHVYEGAYQEYLVAVEEQTASAKKPTVSQKRTPAAQNGRKLSKNEARKVREHFSKLEEEIHALEEALAGLSADIQIAGEEDAFDRMQNLSLDYVVTEAELEAQLKTWEKLAHEQSLAE